ncbi:hypothetical protein [Staphylococcus delphini]|uniref:hypothetical protein n=1 Tax=Staphylococcus delphini TaxID=53344 RepID=UPI0012D2C93F|nr:hypothetical protein [Staphylococcus delphini]MTV19173.1 hypothetical protein [Staphylococcus delphini]
MYSKYIDNSRKNDNSYRSIDEIIENIVNYSKWRKVEKDPYTGEDLDYSVMKCFEVNQELKIKDNIFKYNYIAFSFETLMKGQENNPVAAERKRPTTGFVVVYSDGERTQYIINRAMGATALSILRKINNSDKHKIIEAKSFEFDSDVFLWLISKFKNDNKIDELEELVLKRVTGFKGSGNQATLTGSGNDVMNLFSTLSFIIEMESLKEILVQFQHSRNIYEIRFFESNSQIDVKIENYVGDYILHSEEIRYAVILMHCFIEVIPTVINAYQTDIENKDWGDDKKNDFSNQILKAVKYNIDKVEKTLNDESEKLS